MKSKAIDFPRFPLVLLSIVVLLTIVIAVSTSSIAFNLYNKGWDGANDVRALARNTDTEAEIIRNTTAYAERTPDTSIAIVIAPRQSYTDTEVARVGEYVRTGGTLIVAEDFGQTGNELLSELGISSRFD